MFQSQKENDVEKNYQHMIVSVQSMIEGEKDLIATLANISSVINVYMDRLNWVGFYILKDEELVLGPFQGAPACIRIKIGKGVCGKAVAQKEVITVDDVHTFPGHIACSSETNSEIVIPLFRNDEVFGVLDLDSPEIARFSPLERTYLMKIGVLLNTFLNSME